MPKINLRLTDEEHAALKAWAEGSRRSIQREAVYRLFANRHVPQVVEVPATMVEEIKQVLVEKKVPPAVTEKRTGSCPMDTPRGTKCKSCGKVH